MSRVAIVTAAGQGMGAAIARRLAADGYRLALSSRGEGAALVAREIGPPALSVTGSVTDPVHLSSLVNATVGAFGRIDAVVNNTGHAPRGELLAIEDDDWHHALDLLLLNVVRMARLVTPVMEAGGGGAVVNISTFSAFEPDLAFPVSSTLRAGLGSFTKLYATRYAAAGIRMNNVLPGFIDSYPPAADDLNRIPAGRYGKVEEIAGVVAFLLSDDGAYITGQNLRVDGGLTRSV